MRNGWENQGVLRKIRALFLRPDSGDEGERLAAAFLRRKAGWKIVARNWRNPRDRREELDLVARDGDVLVFVEVKYRSAGALVPGFHAVDRRKKRVLRRAIRAYVADLREKPRSVRLDVVEVTGYGWERPAEIRHFESIPLLGPQWRP